MKALMFAHCAFAAALVAPCFAHAQTNVYRWVDKDGKVQFSDSPPPADAKDATQRRLGGGGDEDTQLPYATQFAKRRNPVTLYSGGDCGDACVKGRELLERRGIPYTERDAQNNDADREALKKLVGSPFVPTLVVGEATTKGYDEDLWQAALDSAGYPKTRLPGQVSLRVPPPPAAPRAAPDDSSAEPASK